MKDLSLRVVSEVFMCMETSLWLSWEVQRYMFRKFGGEKTCRVLFPTLRIHKIIFLNVFPLHFTSKNGFQVEIPTYRGKIKAIPMELHYVWWFSIVFRCRKIEKWTANAQIILIHMISRPQTHLKVIRKHSETIAFWLSFLDIKSKLRHRCMTPYSRREKFYSIQKWFYIF